MDSISKFYIYVVMNLILSIKEQSLLWVIINDSCQNVNTFKAYTFLCRCSFAQTVIRIRPPTRRIRASSRNALTRRSLVAR